MACAVAIGQIGAADSMPKLRVRTVGPNANRLIEDANGAPFFMAGWAPQNIIRWCPVADFDGYFSARHNQGFNMAWVNVGSTVMWTTQDYTDARDYAGNRLHVDPNNPSVAPPNLNMAYVASVDALVQSAQKYGVYLFLNVQSAAGGDKTWSVKNQAECVAWGQFWGSRYAGQPHVNFMLGNDWMPQPQGNWIVSGLKQSMPDRLFVVDQGLFNHSNGSGDYNRPSPWYESVSAGATWINLWGWYVYEGSGSPVNAVNQYATWLMYTQAAQWGVQPAPTFMIESQGLVGTPVEGNGVPGDFSMPDLHVCRRQLWSVPLGGGTGWGLFLHYNDSIDDPRAIVNNPVFTTMGPTCKSFFVTRRWDLLVPDYGHTFLTSQAGNPTIHDPTYVSSALATDGSFGVVYFPGVNGQSNALTVNLSKLGGGAGTSNVRWFDPRKNTYVSVGQFANSGSRTFTTPATYAGGNTDWVLVLEANAAPVNQAPTITTQPVGRTVTVGGSATFSVVAGGTPLPTYQWRKGGANLAGATSASYTTPATVPADNGALFSVVVSNSAGSATSANAVLTVNAAVGAVFADDDSSITGGSRVLGTAAGAAVSSQGTAPFAPGSGSYLHAVVDAATTGRPTLAAYTPASAASSWNAMVGTTADGVHLTLNGGYDVFVRPMGPAGMLGDMSWFRPVDVTGPGGLRLIFAGRGGAAQPTLSMEIKTTAALGLGGSPGVFTTNTLYKMPPNQIIAFNSPVFAIGAVSHVGFTFRTDAATGQITVRLFGCAGSGAIDTTSTANLLASQGFYASAAAIGTTALPTGRWLMVSGPSATIATSADYDAIRLFSATPSVFPALPAVPSGNG